LLHYGVGLVFRFTSYSEVESGQTHRQCDEIRNLLSFLKKRTVLRRRSVRVASITPAILTEGIRDFSQFLQTNAWIPLPSI
jgi:hypothetical protein